MAETVYGCDEPNHPNNYTHTHAEPDPDCEHGLTVGEPGVDERCVECGLSIERTA